MPLFPRLNQRRREPEVMDQPGLDEGRHRQALDGLARINRLSASAGILWPPIRRLCEERRRSGDSTPMRVLDVACGAGDVPVRLWKRARRRGLPLEVAGCDLSAVAVEYARQRAIREGANIS